MKTSLFAEANCAAATILNEKLNNKHVIKRE